ncbi:aspartic-type endopeptidase [Pseudohyphozyma bogoriensis]|nr:aspartic-type endopeptidase [Pseudohyphozyma bogoriensis]
MAQRAAPPRTVVRTFRRVTSMALALLAPKNRIQSNNFQRYFISKPNSYWQAPASLANVNGKVAVSARATHIYDCGTTLIIAPPPCANPPSISFTPSKFRTSYGVAEDDFNLGYVSSDPSRCVGAVVSVNVGLGSSWILGLAFLKNKVVVHNMQSGQIGFAVPRNF